MSRSTVAAWALNPLWPLLIAGILCGGVCARHLGQLEREGRARITVDPIGPPPQRACVPCEEVP